MTIKYFKHMNVVGLSMLAASAFAANPTQLGNTSVAEWSKFFVSSEQKNAAYGINEVKREVDFNRTLHVFLQETYKGYPVLSGQGALHVPNAKQDVAIISLAKNESAFLTGIFYQNLEHDLGDAPANTLSEAQKTKILSEIVENFATKKIANMQTQLVVYVDHLNAAHWAFAIGVIAQQSTKTEMTNAIVDVQTLKIYQHTSSTHPNLVTKTNLKNTHPYEMVRAGGIGGNQKIGLVYYDGLALPNHKPAFLVKRDPVTKICYLEDQDISVKDWNKGLDTVQFACEKTDSDHNNIYWNSAFDVTNGAFNPANDVYYAAQMTRDMFQSMYQAPLWVWHSKPMKLNFFIHDDRTWFWNGAWFSDADSLWYVSFSDGDAERFPRVALDTVAGLIANGYKESHSFYAWGYGSAVGTCYAFSDFFGKAVEYYANKHNVWNVGSEVVKAPNKAIRYLDDPTRDCDGRKPGTDCSIAYMTDVPDVDDIEGDYSAGILNHALFALAHQPGWDTKKAFETMIQANHYYWRLNEDQHEKDFSFIAAGCGMLYAAKDYHYDVEGVKVAFLNVGIDVNNQCMKRK